MYIIQIGTRFFSARRGYFGGLVAREQATLFSQEDAEQRAQRTAGAIAIPA